MSCQIRKEGSRMPDSEAKKKWGKENMILIGMKLHKKNDSDIIEFLNAQGADKQKVIKKAIREYINSDGSSQKE